MLKIVFGWCVFLLASFSFAFAASTDLNVSTEGLALQGYDAVSYFYDKPLEGRPEFTATHQGVKYRFASKANLDRFVKNSDRYLPAYGGWCAWAMLDGKQVKVNPERYKIVGGVNYLFYDGFWGNTLKKWNEKAKAEGEAQLIATADAQWLQLINE